MIKQVANRDSESQLIQSADMSDRLARIRAAAGTQPSGASAQADQPEPKHSAPVRKFADH